MVHAGEGKAIISARSTQGPVALVIAAGGDWFCDADEGTGHAPRLRVVAAGTYAVRVASLERGHDVGYELSIARDGKDDAPGAAPAGNAPAMVSVTVTSEPPGASVRSASGQVLGTTPAMFVVPSPADASAELSFQVVDASGRAVDGVRPPGGGELVLAAALGPVVPQRLRRARRPRAISPSPRSSRSPQPIRDFSTVSQTAEATGACPAITDLAVDVDIRHTYVSDLRVTLTAPDGATAVLHRNRGGARNDIRRTFRASDSRRAALAARPQRSGHVAHDRARQRRAGRRHVPVVRGAPRVRPARRRADRRRAVFLRGGREPFAPDDPPAACASRGSSVPRAGRRGAGRCARST